MRRSLLKALVIVFAVLFTLSSDLFALSKPIDHSVWDQFLKKYVNESGQVDYAGVKKDRTLLDQYLTYLEKVSFQNETPSWPREEALAFWMNAYHAGMVQLVLQYYPIREINQIPSAWDLPVVTVSGHQYGLNQIRTAQLISTFHDEKIHLALSYGAKDGPRLRQEAFTGARVEGQLFEATREFVNAEKFVTIKTGQKKIMLSPLFRWYGADFKLDFGAADHERHFKPEEFAVLSFLAFYLEDAEKIRYLEEDKYKIKYKEFDWSLNEWHRNVPSASSERPASS